MLSSRGGVTGEDVPATKHNRGNGKIISIASLCSFQGEALTLFTRDSSLLTNTRLQVG